MLTTTVIKEKSVKKHLIWGEGLISISKLNNFRKESKCPFSINVKCLKLSMCKKKKKRKKKSKSVSKGLWLEYSCSRKMQVFPNGKLSGQKNNLSCKSCIETLSLQLQMHEWSQPRSAEKLPSWVHPKLPNHGVVSLLLCTSMVG